MKWLRNMKTGAKLLLLVFTGIFCLIAVGGIGFYYMNGISQKASMMYKEQLQPIYWLNDTRAHYRANEAMLYKIMYSNDLVDDQKLLEEISSRTEQINQNISNIETINSNEEDKQMIIKLMKSIESYRKERAYVISLIEKGEKNTALIYFNENALSLLNDVNKLLDEYSKKLVSVAAEVDHEVTQNGNVAKGYFIGISLFAIILSVGLGLLMTNIIKKPINEMLEAMRQAENGNLTIVVQSQSKDEVGKLASSFNKMITSIKVMIGKVSENASTLAASSQQISATTEQSATTSQMQAEEASISAELVQEMTKAIQAVSKNIEEAAKSAEYTSEIATKGGKVIKDTISGMNVIREKILDLANKSAQIDEIVEMIDDIAEQTNLLALNAAIEAARAGDAGKGFAVVADEVRKLAERSSRATKEISALIKEIHTNTDSSVEAVKKGNEYSENAGKVFTEIIKVVQETAKNVSNIAAVSEEQAAQSTGVLTSVQKITASTQETAAGIQQTAATASDLAKMAEELNHLVMKFKVH